MRTRRVVGPVVLLLSLAAAPAARAQPGPERLEVAANLSLLRVSDFGSTNAGIGGRVSFDLTNHVAVEGDVEYLPKDRITSSEYRIPGVNPFRLYHDRHRTTALFGVKIGTRTSRFGAFGKVRPGFTHLRRTGNGGCLGDVECPGIFAAIDFVAASEYRTEFAFDVGGGVEFYPTGRTVARIEVGDTIIRHSDIVELPCYEACTSHNVASRIGFGWRF